MLIININNRYEVEFLLCAVYFWAHMNIERWIVMFDEVLMSNSVDLSSSVQWSVDS